MDLSQHRQVAGTSQSGTLCAQWRGRMQFFLSVWRGDTVRTAGIHIHVTGISALLTQCASRSMRPYLPMGVSRLPAKIIRHFHQMPPVTAELPSHPRILPSTRGSPSTHYAGLSIYNSQSPASTSAAHAESLLG